MEKSTKIIVGVILFGVILPIAIILPAVNQQEKRATDLVGIRDYKAGHYDAAIRELTAYSKAHPLSAEHGLFAEKPQYAQHYLGLALLKQHRYNEAVSVFRVYAQYAASDEKYYLLGTALFYSGNKREARTEFRKTIDDEMQEPSRGRDERLITSSEEWIAKIDQAH